MVSKLDSEEKTNKVLSSVGNNSGSTGCALQSANLASSASSTGSESSDDFEQSFKSLSSRIGDQFQANLEGYEVGKHRIDDSAEKEEIAWSPSDTLSDEAIFERCKLVEVEHFLFMAGAKHSYTLDQGLALLCFHSHDLNKSLVALKGYAPKCVDWTDEDKILFEQAYMYHGKNFNKIKQVMPEKSQASLVNYYYMWKKSRNNKSLIDIQQLSKNALAGYESGPNGSSDLKESGSKSYENAREENEIDDEDDVNYNNMNNRICCNCDMITAELQSTPKGMLCNACYAYWKSTGGLMRPDHPSTLHFGISSAASETNAASNASQSNAALVSSHFHFQHHFNKANRLINQQSEASNLGNSNDHRNISKEAKNYHKSLRKPPKGIYLNYNELVNMAQVGSSEVFDMLDKTILSLKKQIQENKQEISALISNLSYESDLKIAIDNALLQIEDNLSPSPCWSSGEIAFAIQGFARYGTDFLAIAQVIGTKNESAVKAFYNYHKEHFGLDKLSAANPKLLADKASMIVNDLQKLNSAEIPVAGGHSTQQASNAARKSISGCESVKSKPTKASSNNKVSEFCE